MGQEPGQLCLWPLVDASLGFLVFLQATQVQFLGKELDSASSHCSLLSPRSSGTSDLQMDGQKDRGNLDLRSASDVCAGGKTGRT